MRALRPQRLLSLPSGLWALDAVLPVAAVLDPGTGELRRLVSWGELPPPPVHEEEAWPPPRVCSDGTGLWIQQEPIGPLARVTADGVATAVWTGGLHVAAAGPGGAWCFRWGSTQELVAGAGEPVGRPDFDLLLHVSASGITQVVPVDARVRRVHADRDAAWAELEVPPWSLHDLGAGVSEVVWSTAWARLPWDVPPERVSARAEAEAVPPVTFLDQEAGRRPTPWQDLDEPRAAVVADGARWWVGWPAGQPAVRGRWRRVVATAVTAGGDVRPFDLGIGVAQAAAPLEGGALAVALARRPFSGVHQDAPVDLLRLDPASGAVDVLVQGGNLDVTAYGQPLVPRPVEASSYEARMLATYGELDAAWRGTGGTTPLAHGMSAGRARLVGEWPRTQLERTFALDQRPGLRLRRLVPLYDELGRIAPPEHTDIHLMEDLETGAVPPGDDAVNGALDV